MKKSHSYDDLSGVLCPAGCGRKLKKRLVAQKQKPPVCFSCFQAKQDRTGNQVATARQVRTGKRLGRRGGIYNPIT